MNIISLNSQSPSLLCYLLLSQKKQLPNVKEGMENDNSQQLEGVRIFRALEAE